MIIPNIAQYPTQPTELFGIWAELLLLFMIYSYILYKENMAFRFAESTFLATSLAILIVINFRSLLQNQIPQLTAGRITLIIPIILGFAMYLLMVPEYRWVSRYPIAILVGTALGLGLSSRILPNLQRQVINTIEFPVVATGLDWFNFVYIAIGTLLVLMYFILTYEHSGPLQMPSKLARLFIMLGLGTHFGNTVLFRFTMLSGRAEFVLKVLKLIPW